MMPLTTKSSMTMTLGPRRLKMAMSRWSSSGRACAHPAAAEENQLVARPMAISSAPSAQSGWSGVSRTAAMTSGVMNSTRVWAALARRPWWPAILAGVQ